MLKEGWVEESINDKDEQDRKYIVESILKMIKNRENSKDKNEETNPNMLMHSHLFEVDRKVSFRRKEKVRDYSNLMLSRKIDGSISGKQHKK